MTIFRGLPIHCHIPYTPNCHPGIVNASNLNIFLYFDDMWEDRSCIGRSGCSVFMYIHKLPSFLRVPSFSGIVSSRPFPLSSSTLLEHSSLSFRQPWLSPNWYSVPIVGECWNVYSLMLKYYCAIITALLDALFQKSWPCQVHNDRYMLMVV